MQYDGRGTSGGYGNFHRSCGRGNCEKLISATYSLVQQTSTGTSAIRSAITANSNSGAELCFKIEDSWSGRLFYLPMRAPIYISAVIYFISLKRYKIIICALVASGLNQTRVSGLTDQIISLANVAKQVEVQDKGFWAYRSDYFTCQCGQTSGSPNGWESHVELRGGPLSAAEILRAAKETKESLQSQTDLPSFGTGFAREGGAAFSYSEEQQLEDDDAFIPEVVRDERTISTKLKA